MAGGVRSERASGAGNARTLNGSSAWHVPKPTRTTHSRMRTACGNGFTFPAPQAGDGCPSTARKVKQMAQDILKTLKAEHDVLRGLFADLKETTDRAVKTRADLLGKIESALIPHAKWEEEVFYPAFKERADRDGLQTHAEALAEHHAVENSVLPEVHAAAPGTPVFAGRTKVFGEFIEHHAKEEETTMFKMARELFSPDERARLVEDYEMWKQSNPVGSLIAAQKAKAASRAP
jgi:hemerythrin-like domain-containing protein